MQRRGTSGLQVAPQLFLWRNFILLPEKSFFKNPLNPVKCMLAHSGDYTVYKD